MLKKRRNKEEISNQEFIKILKDHFGEIWRDKYLFVIPYILFANLIVIFFTLQSLKFYFLVILGFMACVSFFIGTCLYLDYNAIKKMYGDDEGKAANISKELITFIETKRTRQSAEVKRIFKKIRNYKLIGRGWNFFFNFNSGLLSLSLMYYLVLTILVLFIPNRGGLTFQYITSVFLIGVCLYAYFSFIFVVRSKQYFNLDRIINLLEIAFRKDLDDCINCIKQAVSTKFENIRFNKYIGFLDKWYSYYTGNYFENIELNFILFELHDLYIAVEKEEQFHESLMDVKIKILDELMSANENLNKDIITKSQFVIGKIDNYLDLLEYKIKKKTEKLEKRNKKVFFYRGIIMLIISIISVIVGFVVLFFRI